jgi:hypothetical protein
MEHKFTRCGNRRHKAESQRRCRQRQAALLALRSGGSLKLLSHSHLQIHSPEEFQAITAANKDKLVVLMCKANHCRPCKVRPC